MKENIYRREYYLKKIRPYFSDSMIKVLTGVRRCGKSYIMKSIIQELLDSGIPGKDIVYIDLDKRGYRKVDTADKLECIIDDLITDDDFKYLFIDEIQNVKDFEPLLNGYYTDGNISIFITGSNSYLLSGELVTKLTGRYIEFEIMPLNFHEYIEMKRFLGLPLNDNINREFNDYIRVGGFPGAVHYQTINEKADYVKEIVSQIIKKDIKSRVKIKNVYVFEKVMRYVINNFGSFISLSNVCADLQKYENIRIKPQTLSKYIQTLIDAKILYRINRFDLKSRKSLKGEDKYYLADLSIYYMQNTDARINYGPALENLMFAYLKSKRYELSVGRIGNWEVDFIARQNFDDYYYIQVSMTIMDSIETENREYRPLESIRDNYPKYLFTIDTLEQHRNGIKHLNLIDFILNDSNL